MDIFTTGPTLSVVSSRVTSYSDADGTGLLNLHEYFTVTSTILGHAKCIVMATSVCTDLPEASATQAMLNL